MQDSIKDRIKKLRAEIAEISEANRQYMKSAMGTRAIGVAEHERRLERLQQIERSVIVQESAHKAVEIGAEDQLSGEEH